MSLQPPEDIETLQKDVQCKVVIKGFRGTARGIFQKQETLETIAEIQAIEDKINVNTPIWGVLTSIKGFRRVSGVLHEALFKDGRHTRQ